MRELRHALPRLHFSEYAPPAFEEQAGNQQGLQHDGRGGGRDLPVIALPHAGLAEQDFASIRQAALADAPTPQLAPVKFWRWIAFGLHLDIFRPFAAENSHRNGGRSLTEIG